jgi:hypothetical protein
MTSPISPIWCVEHMQPTAKRHAYFEGADADVDTVDPEYMKEKMGASLCCSFSLSSDSSELEDACLQHLPLSCQPTIMGVPRPFPASFSACLTCNCTYISSLNRQDTPQRTCFACSHWFSFVSPALCCISATASTQPEQQRSTPDC